MSVRSIILRCASPSLVLVLAGCAATRPTAIPSPPATGDASWREVVPSGTVRYQLAMGEISSGGTPFQRTTPVYPPGLLASCPPPQEVPALLIVDGKGAVAEVRVTNEARATPTRHAFIDAVRTAARQWRFNPLLVNHWASDADGNSHVVDSETKPFSLTYAFRFECHAGKSSVSTATGP